MKKYFSILCASVFWAHTAWAGNAETLMAVGLPAQTASKIDALYGTALTATTKPATDNAIDLGSASKQFRSLYVGTSIINSAGSSALILGKTAIAADAGTPALYAFSSSATASQLALAQGTADTAGVAIDILKSRQTNGTADTIVANGDTLGIINFKGSNGATFDTAAQIKVISGGTPGASADMPGQLSILVTPDGSATPTEVMRAFATGVVNFPIGITSNASADIGWALISGANTACNTTCANACVVGQNTANFALVACTDATADVCLCAGAS